MPEPGFAGFAEPYLLDQIYIDGSWVPNRPLSIDPLGPGCWALPTEGGTYIFQRPYRGALKPKDKRVLRFSIPVQADGDAAWYALKKAKAKCAPFYFATGVRQCDAFPAASGSVYRLTSPLAAGIVPGVTSVTHPTVVELDGVVDAGAATVSGQNATANDTGQLMITYTPVHLVYFSAFPESIPQHNEAILDIVLDEVLQS